ncbi:MAG: 2,3-bisphosphoglycerate-independent phosphoglycerate mutase [Spirochaetota bacterium]
MTLESYREIAQPTKAKTVLLVMDGLGGLPDAEHPETELEFAKTPNMDALAAAGITGLHEPVATGVTPGSGPGHLALFGYPPTRYFVGRGVLSALGVDFDLEPGDVAARGNFCTIDDEGVITDRRAGRISTEKNEELCEILSGIELDGATAFVRTVKEHRFLLVLRGEGLGSDVEDTDPHETGKRPRDPSAGDTTSARTAKLLEAFLAAAREKLADHNPANMVLLRGFSSLPDWPTMEQSYGVRAAAIAAYPMYKGVGRLLGMDVYDAEATMESKIALVRDHWDEHDFFFVHVKKTDSHGEDGAFVEKVQVIEEVDTALPDLLALGVDVICITGDHSTPAAMKAHSWHPVPALIWSRVGKDAGGANIRPDEVRTFGERACMAGSLGPRFEGHALLPLAFAHAGCFDKFGA